MPYKDPQKQKNVMQKIMREYRQNKKLRQMKLREAIDGNKLQLAKRIMHTKPNIFAQTWQDMVGQKRRKRK